jgi:hypothetical protein
MFLLSVFFPLLGGLINTSPVARFLGHRGSSIIAISCMVVAFISSVVIYYEVVFMGCAVSVDVFGTWFSVGTFNASWTFNFDLLTANMLFTVTGVSMAVHMYACDYMRQDPHLNLFLGYLSYFTGFMCVLVAADNLLVMLVGWEGKLHYCPNDTYMVCTVFSAKRHFFTARIPAVKRVGLHTSLFNQLLVGVMLGDGWLERHGQGVRLGISLSDRFADVAQFYLVLLYGMGYTDRLELGNPLRRSHRATAKPYYQLRTFTFANLVPLYDIWYNCDQKVSKRLPDTGVLYELLTPFALSVWIMGDGSGMRDGGFKISSHSFTRNQNQLLCDILLHKYGINANVLNEGSKYTYIRVLKRSTRLLRTIVKPYLLPSCEYKFRHVK